MTELKNFITALVAIDDESLDLILAEFTPKAVLQDDFLLRQGQVANEYLFVSKGGFRIYFGAGDKEMTVWIALENNFLCELSSLKTQTPSRFSIQAMENSEVFSISKERMENLYRRFPAWQAFGREVWESAFLSVLDGILAHQTLTAEERYLNAMKQSQLLQRISLKHLASYLGITPTSLSRLRKKIK